MVRLRGRKDGKRKEMTRLGTSRANITHTPNINCTTTHTHTHTHTQHTHTHTDTHRHITINIHMYIATLFYNTYTGHYKSSQVSRHWQSNHLMQKYTVQYRYIGYTTVHNLQQWPQILCVLYTQTTTVWMYIFIYHYQYHQQTHTIQ